MFAFTQTRPSHVNSRHHLYLELYVYRAITLAVAPHGSQTLTGTMLREMCYQCIYSGCIKSCRSAARLHGFEDDLHLKGNQFASILGVLYIGYIVMQIPS